MRPAAELERDVTDYITGVHRRRVVAGRLVRLAVERHLRDLEDGAARGLRFNPKRALRALWWISNRLRFSKGRWAGKPFLLSPWQGFIVWCLFGWERRGSDGAWRRRFKTAYVSVARKNGKTELAAAIGLLLLVLVGESEAGGEVYSAATKRDQAAICWRAAAAMVKKSPELKKEIGVHESRYNLAHYPSESKFETVASDSDTLDGLGPHCAIVDELHAHPTSGVWDVLESGTGARSEPLMLAITTAGEKRSGICWDLETDAIKILEGIGEAEGAGDDLFAFIARLDDGDDPFNATVWQKSNPNLGVSCLPEKLEVAARVAKRRPSALPEYLRKNMNLWTERSLAWLPMPEWDACGGDVDAEALRKEKCFAALDLSAVSDYTAGAVVFPRSDGTFDSLFKLWCPEDTLVERATTDRVPVTAWEQQKLITATSGPVVDQDAVKEWLINQRERYDLQEVAMDPHNATKLRVELEALGFTVVEMRQGWVTMSPAIKETERIIRKKLLRHGGHPVVRWMFSNVAIRSDSNENKSMDKSRSGDRIDGITSLVMALYRASIYLQDLGEAWDGRVGVIG